MCCDADASDWRGCAVFLCGCVDGDSWRCSRQFIDIVVDDAPDQGVIFLIEDIEILERKFIDKKVAEYRSRGYEVEENCELDFLPGFPRRSCCAQRWRCEGDRGEVQNVSGVDAEVE